MLKESYFFLPLLYVYAYTGEYNHSYVWKKIKIQKKLFGRLVSSICWVNINYTIHEISTYQDFDTLEKVFKVDKSVSEKVSIRKNT